MGSVPWSLRLNLIYALVNPATRECRYIGKTRQGLKARLRRHMMDAARSPGARKCTSWIASLVSAGLRPEILEIENCGEQWEDAERFWISYLRMAGANLTNMREGGGGENRCSPKSETRAKISAAAKRQFANPAARAAAADYARAGWKDPAYVKSRREKVMVIQSSDAYRAQQSASKRKNWQDPSYVAKVKQGHAKADHSGGARRMWERPEYREAQRLARERRYGKKEACR